MKWQKLNPFDIRLMEQMYERMVSVHKESPNYDYMIRFKEILGKMKIYVS